MIAWELCSLWQQIYLIKKTKMMWITKLFSAMQLKITGAKKGINQILSLRSDCHLQTISRIWQFYDKLVNLRILIVIPINF